MSPLPLCPKCQSEYTYEDGALFVCPTCAFEWPQVASQAPLVSPKELIVKDAHGNLLLDGDTISLIKDLRIGGGSNFIKMGTKVKGIRLLAAQDGHDIDCKIPGFGSMLLKSEYVKKTK